jgi:hypothetical protein
MDAFTAYKNEFTGQAFQTPEGCLKSEFDHLRDTLVVAVNSTLLLPWLDFSKQCDYLRAKIDALEAKGREYQDAAHHKVVEYTALQERRQTFLKAQNAPEQERQAA